MNTVELLETIANLRLEKDQLLKEKEERDHEIEMLEDMNKKVHSILDKT
jgi:predicted ATP-grasp superfamily ATP-dependent carboligase